MGDAFDRLSMALASGASRRSALAGLLASATALPLTASARRRRNRTKKFKKYLDFCREWCGHLFAVGSSEHAQCVAKAKEGKGSCFTEGPGHFCLSLAHCGKEEECCPLFFSADPVTQGDCCTATEHCSSLNGTGVFCVST